VKDRARTRLLFGPYRPPRLRKGDRATCLYRDCNVIVITWTDARITWPRCKRVEGRGPASLLVDEELARAIRQESAAAVGYWWGVGAGVVWRWRRALGVTKTNNAGSRRLNLAAAQAAAAAVAAKEWTAEERERKRQLAIEGNYAAYMQPFVYHGPRWTDAELALLGTAPDAELASRIGRTVHGVRLARTRRRIPTARDGRKGKR
jgi:hypothetical protein